MKRIREKGKKKSKKIIIIIAIILILMIAFFVYRKVTNKEEGENTVAVQSVGAITGTANTSQNRFSGIVISRKDCKAKKRGK